MHSKITSKGQITLPKALRDDLDIDQGDRIEFIKNDDGEYLIIPIVRSLSSLKGFLPAPDKAVSIEDMNKAIKKRLSDI